MVRFAGTMHTKLALCLALLPLAACAEHRFAGPPPPDATGAMPLLPPPAQGLSPNLLPGAPPEVAPALSASAAPAAADERSWIDAVRLERWAEAATLIDALPEADRARPEMRY